MMTQSRTITVEGVPFTATMWVDLFDSTVDVEATAYVQSQHLHYPGSTLVPVEVDIYTVPMDGWEDAFVKAAMPAISAA